MAYSKRELQRRREDLEVQQYGPEANAFADIHDDRVTLVANALVPLKSTEQAVENICRLWKEAQDKFVAIGRYLLEAKQKFPKVYEREVINRLPFGKQVAFQLATVAKAVEAGLFQRNELPRTYSAAYLLTTLGEDLAEARSRGLVHAGVKRRDIESFKKLLEKRRLEAQGHRVALQKRREELQTKLARLNEQAEAIVQEILQIDADLSQP